MWQIYGDRPGWHSIHAFASAEFQIMKKKHGCGCGCDALGPCGRRRLPTAGLSVLRFLRVWVRGWQIRERASAARMDPSLRKAHCGRQIGHSDFL